MIDLQNFYTSNCHNTPCIHTHMNKIQNKMIKCQVLAEFMSTLDLSSL
jgi:hypothetical protein